MTDSAVTGASCNVFAITSGVAGTTVLGTGISNAGAVEFGAINLNGPAYIQCTGGTFTDEATGQTLSAPNMSAVVNFTPGGTYVISLLSEIASRLALAQGDLGTALTTHNTAVADIFGLDGIDITTQIPTDLNTTNAEDNAAGHFGTVLAALSQAVQDGLLGSTRDEMLAAATTDMAEGRMSPESVAMLDQAMANFMAGSAAAKAHANADVATPVLNAFGAGLRPVANAGSDQNAVAAGSTVTLSGSGTDADGEIAAYQWTQTSGTSVSLANANTATATFTAPSASKLEFTLTVVDNVDNRHSDSVTILVDTAINAGPDVAKTFGDAAYTQAATDGSGTGALNYASSDSNVATIDSVGKVTIVGAGTATITATKAASGSYAAASDSYVLTVAKKAQEALIAGADVTKTFGDVPFTQAASGGSGSGAVTYASSAEAVVTVDNTGKVTIVGAGSATITATKAADANYNAATDSYSVTVGKAVQAALNAGADVTKTFGDAAFTQAASGGSGTGGVSYTSSNASVASVTAAGTVTVVAPGTAVIIATKAADSNYSNVVSDSYTVTVTKATQAALEAGADVTKTFGDVPFTQAASGGSGSGAVTYASSAEAVVTVDNTGKVTIVGAGSATITATKAADANYNVASDSYALTISKAAQTGFSAGNDVVKTDGDAAFTQVASGGQGSGAISYSSDTTSVATVNATSGLVTLVGVGTANIEATRASDANYQQTTDAYKVTVRAKAPTGFAVRAGNAQVVVSWNALTGATSYNLHHATASFGSPPDVANYASFANGTLVQNLTGTSTVVSGLTNGVTYYFVLSGQKATGETAPTEQISVTPRLGILNDTGITFGGNYPSGNNTTCTGETIAQQDCSNGRDAQAAAGTLTKVGGGEAGFDFTKLGADGSVLAVQNASYNVSGNEADGTLWRCVRDNHTGYVWEVKTDDGSHFDRENTYRWGGLTAVGRDHPDRQGTYHDEWNALVNAANTFNSGAGLCGFTDWRVPKLVTLDSIVHRDRTSPAIDPQYFPNTTSDRYWASSPVASLSNDAWTIFFPNGFDYNVSRSASEHVRLVRGGQ